MAKLFIAAIFPGLLLYCLYLLDIFVLCRFKPEAGTTVSAEELPSTDWRILLDLIINLVPPIFLIFMVLGTILFGIASPDVLPHPALAYSMFYLKGIAPPELTMGDIYKGVFPFIAPRWWPCSSSSSSPP